MSAAGTSVDRTSGGKGGGKSVFGGALGALGIVFGDIGTSPLYTYQTLIADSGVGHAGGTDAETLLGGFSLLVWTMMLVVAVKYAIVVMRADNRGEGGILALLSLVGARFGRSWYGSRTLLCAAGLFGAALLYGDGAITPAISVLSAVEGMQVVTSSFQPYVLPIAAAILLGIFLIQPLGTAHIGKVFGPVMLLWFLTIGGIGLAALLRDPAALAGLNPLLGLEFLRAHLSRSLVILGAVFLSVTGAEALYADMSHVGRDSVRLALAVVVLPCLILSYGGQTAFLLAHQGAKGNPFFATLPHGMVLPMVLLATLATIIASQATITGVFTLTRQAIQLGWFPGLAIRQTSDTEYGQIYVPVVNWTVMMVTLSIALAFGSSNALSGAYGTAVSTTMFMTTLLIFDVMRRRWHWALWQAVPVALFFALVDGVFFAANLLKIKAGGYVPLLIGISIYAIMTTWRRGVQLLHAGLTGKGERGAKVLGDLREGKVPRTGGTMVFLSPSDLPVPPIVARHVAAFRSLPAETVVLTVIFEETPRVDEAERVRSERVADGVWHVRVRFGFIEIPNLFAVLGRAQMAGCEIDLDKVIFMAGDDDIVGARSRPRMAPLRRLLFAFLYRNAVRASDRFTLPRERLIEIGHNVPM
ncbi:potassium transporter Kup [Acidomonas methanolica]|uniref:Probable potassium transport system protein Kup n=1 Tax=Acidomonas methanolica NBRC 104435 TaxID=1231351 RepID=A0A023D1K8_ACIMT|nr:KUP/HAK/KT family potassium transporter [Acidomonas methanolica]MBU2654274.1 KUP/HAK/KT family potassium transporter [Acidomonas methanolica]TCS29287.1 KUP system potassium uptake protein [Acidomonas methanolica]GAJ28027.1 potassium transporter Kup system [Acidomonas methanolica NBRC 104435]GBQ45294.1 K+ transporter [Acidomonas methanolica]GEK99309.1 putative potassium transport system protein kup 1 [Acidomonas methanolica NBRC 104435]